MKVLITGAAGVLGRAVTELLEEESGVDMLLTDVAPLDSPHEFRQADLTVPGDAGALCAGIDEVIHIASVHPWKPYTSDQYIDCNIKGTYNILAAAAESDVRRVIYTSSIAAMGMGSTDAAPLPWDETKPCVPDGNLYSVTKHVGEQFCELFRRQGKLSTVALRPGTFIPRDECDTGFGLGLLTQWVHASDVARAHVLALRSDVVNDAFVITAKVPFCRADEAQLRVDARAVVLRYYPQARELAARGIELPATIERCYSIAKAERVLGYRPLFNFEQWLERVLGA